MYFFNHFLFIIMKNQTINCVGYDIICIVVDNCFYLIIHIKTILFSIKNPSVMNKCVDN